MDKIAEGEWADGEYFRMDMEEAKEIAQEVLEHEEEKEWIFQFEDELKLTDQGEKSVSSAEVDRVQEMRQMNRWVEMKA